MKLRVRGNSLRLRLTQTEVAAIARGQAVEEALHFAGGGQLRYVLAPDGAVPEPVAAFREGTVLVSLPLARAIAWARGGEVALQSSSGYSPSLLVEKDFACLKPRAHEHEDESDLFPNPNLAHGHCT